MNCAALNIDDPISVLKNREKVELPGRDCPEGELAYGERSLVLRRAVR